MKKILATTDFSENSKPGLFFAIQLASQNNFELTFFHTFHILIPTAWNEVRIEGYEKDEAKNMEDELNLFENNFNFICLSTKSAGAVKRLLATNQNAVGVKHAQYKFVDVINSSQFNSIGIGTVV